MPARWPARSRTARCSSRPWQARTAGAPRARSTARCARRRRTRLSRAPRLAVSPRLGSVDLDADVAAGFDRVLEECRRLGATIVEPPPPGLPDAVGQDFVDVLTTEMLVYHRRFDHLRDGYRPSLREWVETGERRAMSGEEYVAAQARRRETTGAWAAWLAEHRIDALLEPTIPVVAPLRGDGYDHAGTDYALISLTHLWDWTGFPVAALPAGVGGETGLPVGVSLVGPAGTDRRLLALGIALQAELGVPEPPGVIPPG